MDRIADHEKAPKSLVFAKKVRSLRSFRAICQTSVMRDRKVFPFRKRVTQKCSETPQTPQTLNQCTNCN